VDIGRSQIYVNGSKEKNGFVLIMGRVAINGTMVRFSSVASELFVFMVKTPIWGMIIPSWSVGFTIVSQWETVVKSMG